MPLPASSATAFAPPTYQSGYVPARTPTPKSHSPVNLPTPVPSAAIPATVEATATASVAPVSPVTSVTSVGASSPVVTRVRALHTFEPTEAGELAFEKGDVIKVVDRGYKDWWRGQLKGRTGIFPVNYVVGTRTTFVNVCFG